MKPITRRDVLKTGLLAPAATAMAQGVGPIRSATHAWDDASGPLSVPETLTPPAPGAGRERLLLDFGWRFHLGNANDAEKDFHYGSSWTGNFEKTGNFLPAATAAFDDSDWSGIDLPHDWAVELPFVDDPGLLSAGFHPLGRKYPATSVGWYRRIFDLPAEDVGKRITLEFEGAYRDTLVVFNGFFVGQHTGGYDPFSFDVTDFANPGQRNVLLVRVDATQRDGWFYEGAGIYRHVWLVKTNPVHVKKWGTFVRSEIRGNQATLSVLTEVENHGKMPGSARVVSTIVDPSGSAVAKDVTAAATIQPGSERNYRQKIEISHPSLWSLEERNRYKLLTEIRVNGKTVDRYETTFGIRSIRFDAQHGFFLNGKHVKLRGTCNHQDHAGVGVAVPDAVQYYRIRKLQEMGCNAIRTSHNPPTPALLDACDRLGMLVFDETRMMSSNPEGLHQFGDLVRRDRNRPCVFMWSMGNEEPVANTPRGVLILSAMKALAARYDGSRPVSIAPTAAIGTGGLAVCDVIGYNYMDPQAAAYHKTHPDRPVMGTENVSAVGTRGIYITDPSKGYVSSYDPYTTTGRASAEGWWQFCDAQPWLAGGFVWTGFDYRGEPSPDGWPNVSSQYGIVDTCGFPKDTFYYYQSWWTQKPVLHLFPHWNWPAYEGREIAVWVYSNLDKVELFHNGKSLGIKAVEKNSHVAWNVKYLPGSLEARGWKDGKHVMTTRRDTTGPAAKLVLLPDRKSLSADGVDVAMFSVAVQDASGRVVPITNNLVTFRITGPARLIGVGNGDPTDQSPDKGTSRKAFSGYCMALVQSDKSPGTITVEATSPGLAPATASVACHPAELEPQVSVWKRSIPEGEGITGLWRPVNANGAGGLVSFLGYAQAFTFRQKSGRLEGSVESFEGYFGNNGMPVPITDGAVNGDRIAFKSGRNTYEGIIQGDEIKLERSVTLPFHFLSKPEKPAPNRPAIGPPPDGTDPSLNLSAILDSKFPVVLKRAGS